MKILLLTDEMQPGGVPRHVCDLANGLNERGITPIVAATDGPFRSRLSDGIRFINIRLLKPGSFRKRTTGFFTAYRSLSRLLRFRTMRSHPFRTNGIPICSVACFRDGFTSLTHPHAIIFSNIPFAHHIFLIPSSLPATPLPTRSGNITAHAGKSNLSTSAFSLCVFIQRKKLLVAGVKWVSIRMQRSSQVSDS